MSGKNKFSRRDFLVRSASGAGYLAVGDASSVLLQRNGSGSPLNEAVSPRNVRVMSISRSGLESEKDIVERMIDRIKIMSLYKPDIICLPEVFNGVPAKDGEQVPGPVTMRMASVAREYGSYIICPIHTRKNGRAYNSAILIDRKGNVTGQYDKIHPVSVECVNGVTPGSSPPPVFKTDFGIIGMQICFDCNWTEEWKSLKEQGAEIVFWPSAFPGGRMLPSLAWMFKYYVVGCSRRDPSTIYDITGDLISSSGQYEHWAFADLNLEKVFLETVDYSRKLTEIKKKYGSRLLIRYFHDEDWITIESRHPDLRIKSILDEYKLIPHWDYIKMEEKEQNRYRKA
jgi:beta-ureidopropionase